MVARILIIASVACVFNFANGISAPFPGFKPCKSSDDACVLQNVKYGMSYFIGGQSELGIESSDPDHYARIDASTPNLKFILSNLVITGLKKCKAIKAKRDGAKMQIVLVLECNVEIEGDYEMKGEMLFAKIEGADKARVELPKVIFMITANYIYKEGKDGKKYIRIKNFEHSYELKEKATVVFEGLFPDNEVLRAAIYQVLKDNPNEVIYEIGGGLIKAIAKNKVEFIKKFFANIPYEELSLD